MEILDALRTTVEKVKQWTSDGLNKKVDKVGGKGLSTNDYTAADKEKVLNMPNDLVVADGMLYLAQDGVPITDSAVTLPSGGGGGTGGGSSSDDVTVENKSPSTTFSAALGTDVWVQVFFASPNSGNGMAHIFVTSGNNDRTLKGSVPIVNGEDNPINLKDYIAGGMNIVDIVCSDKYGLERTLQYTINAISLAITTSFSDSQVFEKSTGIPISIKFDGNITKTLHFEITYPDLTVKDYSIPNIEFDGASNTYDILKVAGTLSHGTYLTKVYTTATADDGTTITSNVYTYDIMYSEGKTTPLISSVYNVTSVAQGTPISIPFTVYHTTQTNPEVTLSIEPSEQDGKNYLPDIRTVPGGVRQPWNIKNYPTGEVTFTISYGGVSKSHTVTITPSTMKQKVRTDNMKFYISAAGKSNESAGRDIWNGVDDEGNIVASTTFTDVNWAVANKRFETSYEDEKGEVVTTTTQYAIGTGWATDSNGDTVLRLAGNARALIDFKPYEVNPKTHGKTIELVFAIRDVNNRDAVAMSCMSGGVGFTVTSDTTTFTNGSTSAVCNYVDGEKLHVTLVIEPQGTDDNPNTRLFCAYLNGVMSSAMQYTTVESLHQGNPVGISVGSSECSIDLYSIRTYDIALTKEEVRDNFIADSGDISISIENDIYSGSSMLLTKVETQIPVMRITGALPSLKNDSNKKKGGKDYPVKIVYTDPINTDLNFTDNALIHVQGTSSEGYPRKNWKIEFNNEHQHMPGMIPSDVFCMKTDFAENTGSHNTGNANYAHTFYDKVKTPPQEADSRIRTTIAGFPCVIFHRLSESGPYTFAGRYNFNYEKSSNNAYGLTDEYPNSESWEFRENKELACQFLDEIPQDVDAWNGPIFEARHPDGSEDIEAFRIMHEWVLSTNQAEATGGALIKPYVDVDGVTHTNDTAEYRLAKFKTEFEEHFELDFMLIYYLYTFVMLMVDQRAKNMFLTTWDKVHFQAWLYDNDTCLGINNEGKLVFDYYHQDYGENSTSGVQDVYNGKTSVLWTNFHEAFAKEIQTLYQSWRVSGSEKLSYNKMLKYFITDQTDKWSISMYNEDAEFKYIAALRNNNNSEYLYQVRGTGEEHLKYFIKNRLMFCDSKWFTGDFVATNNRIVLRTNTPLVDGEFAPNPTISYKTFSNMYAAVRYGTNTKPIVQYTPRDTLVSLGSDVSTIFKDTDTYIFGADQISYLADLSLLYCSTVNISAATKLVELNIGRADEGYENPNLKGLSFTNNKLLRKVNVCNCNGFTSKILDFSLCPDIQEVLATGSNITGIDLPDSGYLKIAKLPATIDTIKLVNQKHIQTFECEGYENLKSIRIENSVNVPVTEILSAIQDDNYPNVRIINMDWNVTSTSELSKIVNKLSQCKALDASGLATADTAVVTGRVHVNDTVSEELRAFVHQHFPDLVIIDNTGNTFYYVDYLTIDGEIYATELILADETPGGPGTNPDNIIMDDHRYLFQGWDMSSFKKNQNNRISGIWQEQFALKFYANKDDINPVHTQWADKGDIAQDPVSNGSIDPPIKPGTGDIQYKFNGWENLPTNVQMAINIYASYDNMHPVRYYVTNDATTPHYEQWIVEGENAHDPSQDEGYRVPEDIVISEDEKQAFYAWDNIPINVTAICKVYAIYDTYWAVRFYNESKLVDLQWIKNGDSAVDPLTRAENPIATPTKKSTAQYDYIFSKWDDGYTNVTDPRSVAAIYTSTIRRYNVYFYNDSTLLQTVENIQYGSSTSYTGPTPTKLGVDNPEEYVFKGWVPEPKNITGETKCYALFKFTGYLFGKLAEAEDKDEGYGTVDNPNWNEINAYWTTIQADVDAYNNGTMDEDDFKTKYQIGGRMIIPITLSDGDAIADVEIIGIKHDDLADGSGKATLTFFCKDLPDIKMCMYESGDNTGGWKDSDMRAFVNDELYNGMPPVLKENIKTVNKIADGGRNNKALVTTEDKCWLMSLEELGLGLKVTQNLSGQGTHYSSVFRSKEDCLKNIYNDTQAGRWWFRSSYYSNSDSVMFFRINTLSGGYQADAAAYSYYVAFGFCI